MGVPIGGNLVEDGGEAMLEVVVMRVSGLWRAVAMPMKGSDLERLGLEDVEGGLKERGSGRVRCSDEAINSGI